MFRGLQKPPRRKPKKLKEEKEGESASEKTIKLEGVKWILSPRPASAPMSFFYKPFATVKTDLEAEERWSCPGGDAKDMLHEEESYMSLSKDIHTEKNNEDSGSGGSVDWPSEPESLNIASDQNVSTINASYQEMIEEDEDILHNYCSGGRLSESQNFSSLSQQHQLKIVIPHSERKKQENKMASEEVTQLQFLKTQGLLENEDCNGYENGDSELSLQEKVDKKIEEGKENGHLDFSGMELPFVPLAILSTDVSMIHRLSLQDNCLVEVPGSTLIHLSSLTWLDLRYNKLSALPSSIHHLRYLQVLLLQGNLIKNLPNQLGALKDLTTLQLSDNPLEYPPYYVIRSGIKNILNYLKSALMQNGQWQTKIILDNQKERESFNEKNNRSAEIDNVEPSSNRKDTPKSDVSSDEDSLSLSSSANDRNGIFVTDCPENFLPSVDIIPININSDKGTLSDSGHDSLGIPPSPSPRLLTPNAELPSSARYIPDYLQGNADEDFDDEIDEQNDSAEEENDPWQCQCFQSPAPLSSEKLRIVRRISNKEIKLKLLQNISRNQGTKFYCDENGHRRSAIHIPDAEEDTESLEGDLGEGCRRPVEEFTDVSDFGESHVSVVAVPVVCIELETNLENSRNGRAICTPLNNRLDARKSRKVSRNLRRPRLVTSSDVYRKTRHQRYLQRESSAALRELEANQKLRSHKGLTEWRDDYKKKQQLHLQFYDPASFVPLVCKAPFAIDGTLVTPKTRKIIERQQKKNLQEVLVNEDNIKEVAEDIDKCINRLKNQEKEDEIEEEEANGEVQANKEPKKKMSTYNKRRRRKKSNLKRTSSLAQTALVITQLNQIRKQIQRLKVNKFLS